MKIVILGDAFVENADYQINNFIKYYIKKGHEVTIICSTILSIFDYYSNNYNKSIKESTKSKGKLKIIRKKYSLNILYKIRRFNNVLDILQEEKPELIFVEDIHFNLNDAVQYKRINGTCKIIMNFHTDFSNSAKNWLSYIILHKGIRGIYLNYYLKDINRIFPVVGKSKYFLKKMYGIPNNKMEILPLGVDSDLVNEILNSDMRDKVRNLYNIPKSSLVIFTGGKMSSVKQTDVLLKAVNELNNPEIYLFIAGKIDESNSQYHDEFIKLVELNKNIIQLGWISTKDIYNIMSACDVAVFPASQSVLWQYSIGMGLVLIAGKYVKLNNGKIWEQDIEYLNLNSNIFILPDMCNKLNLIKDYLNILKDDVLLLERMKKGSLLTTEQFLNFNLISEKSININN